MIIELVITFIFDLLNFLFTLVGEAVTFELDLSLLSIPITWLNWLIPSPVLVAIIASYVFWLLFVNVIHTAVWILKKVPFLNIS